MIIKLADQIVKDISSLNWRQLSFLSTMILVMLVLCLYWNESALGIISGITGVITVFLVNMRKITNYFWGLINVVIYGWLAYQATYFGDAMLNWGFYLPIQFIGAYMWYNSMDGEEVISRKLDTFTAIPMFIGATLLVYMYSKFLGFIGGSLSVPDATTTVLSVIATFLMVKGYREQWLAWIAVNIISIYMWVAVFTATGSAGIGVLLMWIMFLTNSIYGTYTWFRAAK